MSTYDTLQESIRDLKDQVAQFEWTNKSLRNTGRGLNGEGSQSSGLKVYQEDVLERASSEMDDTQGTLDEHD